jgi:hypothetical protein
MSWVSETPYRGSRHASRKVAELCDGTSGQGDGPWKNRHLFEALAHAIRHMIPTGKLPYPMERMLLASGVLGAAMHSRAANRRTAYDLMTEFPSDAQWGQSQRETAELFTGPDLVTLFLHLPTRSTS